MGGNIRKDIAVKHRHNALRIMDIFDITESPQKLSDVIEQKLNENVWKPNTARTYMNSYKMFLNYMSTMASWNDNQEIDLQHIAVVKDQIVRIANTLTSMAAKEKKSPCEVQQEVNCVNPADLMLYFNSARSSKAKVLLSSKFDGTRKSHTAARNHLLMRLATSNAHRTACLSNMTLREFQKANPQSDK